MTKKKVQVLSEMTRILPDWTATDICEKRDFNEASLRAVIDHVRKEHGEDSIEVDRRIRTEILYDVSTAENFIYSSTLVLISDSVKTDPIEVTYAVSD